MNILLVCTGNTCRSPMAEGIFKDIAKKQGKELEVNSAGIFAMEGSDISENAVKALEDIGIDISKNKSRSLTKEMLEEADLILGMSKAHISNVISMMPEVKDKAFTLNEYSYNKLGDIEDPYGGDLELYMSTRNEILRAIQNIFLTKEEFK